MTTRTVNIALIEAVPQVRTVVFKPRLASVDGGALLQQVYSVTTNSSGVGSIALPVKTGGSIRYDYEIPKVGGKSIGHFVLAPGSAVDLHDLIAAGGMPSDSVLDYIDDAISGISGNVATDVIFDAKGDLVAGTGSNTATRLPVGANDSFLVPDSAVANGLKWIAPSAAKTILNLTGTNTGDQYGSDKINIRQALGSTTKAETWPLERLATSFNLVDNRMELAAVWLPVAATLTGVKWWQAFQGVYTADNNNKVGLYTYNGSGTLTLVASSANDGNIWKAGTQNFASKAFSSTYAAAAGLYFIALLYNSSAQTTAPGLVAGPSSYVASGGSVDYTNNAKSMGMVTGLNDLPATQAMSGVSQYGIPIYMALY